MPRFSTVHRDSCVSLIRHSELTLSASSCLWRRRGKKKKKRKILNSLETPVPWAVWCHWTRPSLSRNRSGLVDGIHAGSACRGSKSCPRMVKYLRAWRGGLAGELILMGLSSFPSQTCCLKRFGWLVNLERNLSSSWKKKTKQTPTFSEAFQSFLQLFYSSSLTFRFRRGKKKRSSCFLMVPVKRSILAELVSPPTPL